MPRKIVVRLNTNMLLQESKAQNELELQELVKNNPDLLPIEDFEMSGPLLVVGRETSLPSGGVDLVALARSGELLVIEFKTGPENSDFRRVLAQLLDYGSDMWSLTYDEFEATVPIRYFSSVHCQDERVRGKRSVDEAAREIWPGISDDELGLIRERVIKQLESGHFHYVMVAQRFTSMVEKTAEYLNQVMNGPRTYAVEVVRFDGDGIQAFEARTVLKPPVRSPGGPVSYLDEEKFLQTVTNEAYLEFLKDLLDSCRGLGFRFEWGTSGVSIRMPTIDMKEPLTVGWIFEPGRWGWNGLRDLNLGYSTWSANQRQSVSSALAEYLDRLRQISGGEVIKAKDLADTAYHFAPEAAMASRVAIKEALAKLAEANQVASG